MHPILTATNERNERSEGKGEEKRNGEASKAPSTRIDFSRRRPLLCKSEEEKRERRRREK
jgi:hypothetical protein